MTDWIERFKRLFRPRPNRRPPLSDGHLSSEVLAQVAGSAAMTRDVEYSCDDVYRLLDECAEAVLRGEDLAQLMPLVQRHLEMCPDCREEFEALLRVLRAGQGG